MIRRLCSFLASLCARGLRLFGRKPAPVPAYVSHVYLGVDQARRVHQYRITHQVDKKTRDVMFECHARTDVPKPDDVMARYFQTNTNTNCSKA